jgi:predicted flap endonuclease-1-like 5' DNA nuclease
VLLSLSSIAQQAQPTGGGIVFLLVMFIIFVVVLVMVWYALRGKRISSQSTEEQISSLQSRDAEDHVEAGAATEEPTSESAPAADVDRRKLLPPVPAETLVEDATPTGAPSSTLPEVEPAEETTDVESAEPKAVALPTEAATQAEVSALPTDGEQKSDETPASPVATDIDTATAADDETRVAIAVPAADAEQPADAVPDSPAVPDEVVADAPSTVDESTVDESTVDESTVDESTVDESTVDESTVDESQARPAEEPVQQTEKEVVSPTTDLTVADEAAAAIPAAAPVDNLKQVEGIGPKIASVLAEAGITSFAQLAAMTPEQISTVLEGKVRLAVPDTWPEQAKLAAEGKWDELKQFQSQLRGGRRV